MNPRLENYGGLKWFSVFGVDSEWKQALFAAILEIMLVSSEASTSREE